MDWTILLPQIAFNLLLLIILTLYIKYYHLPSWINSLVEYIPLDLAPMPDMYKVHLKSINDKGLVIAMSCLLPQTKLPLWFMSVLVRIPSITIREYYTNELVGVVYLQTPILLDGKRDMLFDQIIRIDVSESISGLKTLIKRISVVGIKEVGRITLKMEFNLTFSINDLFVMERVPCSKKIDLGELINTADHISPENSLSDAGVSSSTIPDDTSTGELNSETSIGNTSVASVEIQQTNSISSKPSRLAEAFKNLQEKHLHHLKEHLIEDYLFPPHEITPFANPGLRGIEAGLEIIFSRPPELNLALGKIQFKVLLNGSTVARTVITGIYFSNTSLSAKPIIEVQPAALSSRPITGALTTAKGIFIGAVKGAANGLLYKDWGGNAVVLGLKEISIENQDGRQIWWVDQILDGLEYEQDLDAVRKVRKKMKKKTSDIKDGVNMMIMKVIEESNCPIM